MEPLLLGFDWLSPQAGAVLLLGLTCAGLGLLLDRVLVRRPRPSAPGAHPADSPEDPERGDERRAWPRQQVAATKVLMTHTGLPEPIEAWVLDTSLGGIGLSAAQPVEVGTVLSLWPVPAAEPARRDLVEVKYCRLHRGRWRLGCRTLGTPAEGD